MTTKHKRLGLLALAALAGCGGANQGAPRGQVARPATQLAFTAEPAAVQAGAVLRPAIQVTVEDVNGQRVMDDTRSVSLSRAEGTLGGTVLVNAVAGVATFAGVSVPNAAARVVFTATAPGLKAATSTPFAVSAGAPSAATSSLSASPASVVADGQSTTALLATALDAEKNPIAGQLVSFAASGAGNSLSASSCTTAATGACTVTIASTKAQAETITATFGGVTETATVTFEPGAANSLKSTLQLTPASAAAGTSVAIAVAARDAQGNAIPAQAVSLSASGSGNTLTPASSAAGANGSFNATLTSTVAQTETVTATLGAATLTGSITFAAAALSSAHSTLSASPARAVADGSTAITIKLVGQDAFGNPLAGQTVKFAGAGSFGATSGTLDSTGTFSTTLVSTVAGAENVTATVGAASVTASVTFTPGPPSSANSSLSANPASVVADGAATIALTFTGLDAKKNPISGQLVSFGASGASNSFSASSCTTAANGACTVTLASTKAQAETITASFGGVTKTAAVTFVPGVASSLQSRLRLTPASPAAGTNVAIVVAARDAQGNAIPAQAISLSASGSSDTFTPALGAADSNGIFTATLVSSFAQTETVTATLGAATVTGSVTVGAAGLSSANSSFSASPVSAVADGASAITLKFTGLDAFGNPLAGQQVQFTGAGKFAAAAGTLDAMGSFSAALTSTAAGTGTVTATVGAASLTTSVTFTPGAPFSTTSSLSVNPASVVANGSAPITLTFTGLDAFGNPVAGQTAKFTGGGSFGATSGTLDSAGTFSTTLTSTVAGPETVTATAGAASDTANVSFTLGAPSSSNSSLAASPAAVNAGDGSTIALAAAVLDAQKNAVPGEIVMFTSSGTNNTFGATTCTTDSTGHCSTTLASTDAQSETATAAFGGMSATASVTFNERTPDGSKSTIAASPTMLTAGQKAALTVIALDAKGVPIGHLAVALSASGASNSFDATSGFTDQTGSFVTNLSSTKPQTETAQANLGPSAVRVTSAALVISAGTPSATASTIVLVGSPIKADGTTKATLTVVAKDQYGNAAIGVAIALTSSLSSVKFSPSAAQNTDATGTAVFQLTATAGGVSTILATAGGVTLPSQALAIAGAPIGAAAGAVLLSGGLTGCTTAAANESQKLAIDSLNLIYAAMICGNSVYVAVSADGGATFSAPVFAHEFANDLQLAAGAGGHAYALTYWSGSAWLSTTSDGGATWSNQSYGQGAQFSAGAWPVVGVATSGDNSWLAWQTAAGTQLVRNLATGTYLAGAASPLTNAQSAFWRLLYDQSTGALLDVAEDNTLVAAASIDNDYSWLPVSVLAGAMQGYSSWAAGGGQIYNAGNTAHAYRLSESSLVNAKGADLTPVLLTNVAAGDANQTAVAADGNGDGFFASASSGKIVIQRVTATGTVLDEPIQVVASGGSHPNILPATSAGARSAVVEYTTANGVYAQVVSFPATTINPGFSSIAAQPTSVLANGVSAAAITVAVVGSDGNPVAGQSVSFSGAGAGGTLTPASGTTGADGKLTTQLTSTVAQSETVTAIAGQLTLTTGAVTFTPDIGDPVKSTAVVNGSPIPDDGAAAATITVTSNDAAGLPVKGSMIALAAPPAGFSVSPSLQQTADSHGVALFSVTARQTGSMTVSASVDGAALVATPVLVAIPRSIGVITSPVLVSGTVSGCTTATSNASQKLAADASNHVYLIMNCGGTGYVSVSSDGGATFAPPQSTGIANVTVGTDELQIAGGPSGTAYVAGINSAYNVYYSMTSNSGATWSAPAFLGSAAGPFGLGFPSILARGSTVWVSWLQGSGPAVFANATSGVGGFTFQGTSPVPFASDNFWRVLADPASGYLYSVGEHGTLAVAASWNGGVSWGPAIPVAGGVTQSYSAWASGGGYIFNAGSSGTAYRLAIADINQRDIATNSPDVAATTITGVSAGVSEQTSAALDAAGVAYIASTSGSGVVSVQAVAPSSTSVGAPVNVVASGGSSPAILAGTNGYALVAYTQGGGVYARVVQLPLALTAGTAASVAVAPVQVSGAVAACSTVNANASQKLAVDAGNLIYVLMNCGGAGYVAVSHDGGISYSAPVSTGITGVVPGTDEMQIATGALGAAYVAGYTNANTIAYSFTQNGGATWTGPATVGGAASNPSFGLASIGVHGATVFIGYLSTTGTELYENTTGGVGAFTARGPSNMPLADTTFWRVFVDPASGYLYDASETNNLYLNPRYDDTHWGSVTMVAGATQGWSSWAPGGGYIFNAGQKPYGYRIALSDIDQATIATNSPTVPGTTLTGLVVGAAQQTAIAADAAGNAFVAVMTPSGIIEVQSIPIASTLAGPAVQVVGSGTSPNVVAGGAGSGAAVVSYTANNAVYAAVVVPAAPPSCLSGQLDCQGTCASIQTDTNNCGACGYSCGPNSTCTSGVCGCIPTAENCGGTCTSFQDPNDCGACGNVCPAGGPNCNSTSQGGTPVTSAACGCGTGSIGICSGGETCNPSTGVCSCPSGDSFCPTGCLNLSNDTNNCGQCYHACAAGWPCSGGVCQNPCAGTSLTWCPNAGACVNTTTDINNCGGCGITCTVGPGGHAGTNYCSNSACGCSGTDLACDVGASDPMCSQVVDGSSAPGLCMAGHSCYCTNPAGNDDCGCCGNVCPSGKNCVISSCL